jgi:ATP-dependent helicase HepA
MTRSSSQTPFVPGQRWLSETEPELGMGVLIAQDSRTLTLEFPENGCTRQYSRAAAPIRRMRFKPGDRISTLDGRDITVEKVAEEGGILTYIQGTDQVPETALSSRISVDLPFDRLVAGLSGDFRQFDLRREIRTARADYQASEARGFLGGKVDLIPHQLYIAGQVCSRYFPRVLLSDETGLGKTIEAGLVLHRMMALGRIRRVLIIVPQSLAHQWFIEMFRKFSLRFRLFDREYIRQAAASEPGMNPFSLDQQGIITQDFIMAYAGVQEQILDEDWDMVVMDEAHHMTDDPGFYRFLSGLGAVTRGLMLLTATPEQMGTETHFAQLRLLDPDRYHDLETYRREAEGYEAAANDARALLDQGKPVDRILDTFGPGRVVFRNRRRSIQGFPERSVDLAPLPGTRKQIAAVNGTGRKEAAADLAADPRVAHLAALCRSVKPEKILVICRSRELVEGIVAGLKQHIAVDAARFDETMDLLQRDRQAAWFADPEGARLLVCSEIGSEGRNFQFVRRLYLFDLPPNPELLEQRIGRVDRIGQREEIIIHVPYVKGSVQEILALWYDRGMGLFRENVNGLHGIFTRFASRLKDLMARAETAVDQEALAELIEETAAYTRETLESLDQGRHILLELNSFRPGPAGELIEAIRKTEQAGTLYSLMERLLDRFGMEMDLVGRESGVVSLTPDRVVDEAFPALPGGARFATFDRATAIARDDLDFLTWDHPFVHQAMEYFVTQGEGTAAAAVLEGADAPGVVLETLYLLEIPDQNDFSAAGRFLPPSPVHILVDHGGKTVAPSDLGPGFPAGLKPDAPGWFLELPDLVQTLLPDLLARSAALADEQAAVLRQKALTAVEKTLGAEMDRLVRLSKINPGITRREIDAAVAEQAAIQARISGASLRLDAVRLIRLS